MSVLKAAGILFVTPDRQALFLKRGPGGDNPGEWCFPGGRLEEGETLLECAVREAIEECGAIPDGERIEWTRRIANREVTAAITPPVVADTAPADAVAVPGEQVDFTTFVQRADKSFDVTVGGEHTGWSWAQLDAPPEPLHPGCRIALQRFMMNELDIAKAMAAGELTSPQVYENVTLFAIRITGTGVAYRKALDEFVYRAPENYLTPEFLERCNGLPVIWIHPPETMLDSAEFAKRVVGTIMVPYIRDDDVWGIAKIYDADAIKAMTEKQLSTSPGVLASGRKLKTANGSTLLLEGSPDLLDHIAIVDRGVWDKLEGPTGVETTGVIMADEDKARADAEAEVQKKFADAMARGDKKKKGPLEGFEAGGVFHPIRSSSGYSKKKAGDSDDDYRSRHDAEEGNERKALEEGGATKEQAADRAGRHRKDAEAEEEKERKDAESNSGETLNKLLSKLDAMSTKVDALERRDADETDAEKRERAERQDAARRRRDARHFSARGDAESDEDYAKRHDAEEDGLSRQLEEEGEPKEMAADRAKRGRKDAEESEAKERERKDSQVIGDLSRQIDELKRAIPRARTDADTGELLQAQARADNAYSAWGDRAPRPLDGETAVDYRRRLLMAHAKHSKAWGSIDISKLSSDALAVAETQVYADSQAAAANPSVGVGMLIPRRKTTETGHTVTTFVGDSAAFINRFAPNKQIGHFRDGLKGRAA